MNDDQYKWEAQYNDATTLKQRDADNKPHAYAEIDRDKLAGFLLRGIDGQIKLHVVFENDGHKLIWTRRVFHSNDGVVATVHIVGKKGEFVLGLFPDGSVVARHGFVDDGLFDEVING